MDIIGARIDFSAHIDRTKVSVLHGLTVLICCNNLEVKGCCAYASREFRHRFLYCYVTGNNFFYRDFFVQHTINMVVSLSPSRCSPRWI